MLIRAFFLSLAISFSSSGLWAQTPAYTDLDSDTLTQMAEAGDAEAAFTLAINALDAMEGVNASSEEIEAVLALMEAADALGSAEAANTVAAMYSGQFAPHIAPDKAKAEAALGRAINRGSEAALLNSAMQRLSSPYVAQQDEGIAGLESLVDSEVVGGIASQYLLEIYMQGFGSFQPQIEKIEPTARRCADNPDSEGHCALIVARALQNGWGRPVNAERATKWFARAAKAGDARAQWSYGMAILQGVGVAKDSQEAFKWVKAAAEQDYVNGLISFAVMNAQGDGTEIDLVAAYDAYERAAKLGNAHALRGLSGMVYAGEGRPADPDRGIAGLIVAHERGDKNAANVLNLILDEPADLNRAIADKRESLRIQISEVEKSYPVRREN